MVPVTPVERRGERRQAVRAGGVGAGLQVRLVDLHDVGARGVQVLDLRVDRGGVRHRGRLEVRVVVVLRLLGHRERPGHRHLHRTVGVRLEELQVADLDRGRPGDRPDDARHRVGVPGAVERGARVVDVDAVERGGEVVGVALAADLAVGDEVEARALLGPDGHLGGVVLRLGEVVGLDAPQLLGPHARREAAREPGPVDQPLRLRVAADQGRGQERERHHDLQGSGATGTAPRSMAR